MTIIEDQLGNLPDFAELRQRLRELENTMPALDKKCNDNKYFAESAKSTLETLIV